MDVFQFALFCGLCRIPQRRSVLRPLRLEGQGQNAPTTACRNMNRASRDARHLRSDVFLRSPHIAVSRQGARSKRTAAYSIRSGVRNHGAKDAAERQPEKHPPGLHRYPALPAMTVQNKRARGLESWRRTRDNRKPSTSSRLLEAP